MDPTLTAAVISALGGIVTIVGWLAKRHIQLINNMEKRIEDDRKDRVEQLQKAADQAKAQALKEAEQAKELATKAAEKALREAAEKQAQIELNEAMISALRQQGEELRVIVMELRSLRAGQDRMAIALDHEVSRMDVVTEAMENVVGEDVMEQARATVQRREAQNGIMLQGERVDSVAAAHSRRSRPSLSSQPSLDRISGTHG
ncbi:hypothetical protein EKK58_05820 [Candidatus Dependentiae bacterium]|nr:MAG: hypothetical protein EKK58_05820 [Candidatus Dependentiae bacterium]